MMPSDGRWRGTGTRRRLLFASLLVLAAGLITVLMGGSIARSRQGFSQLFVSGVVSLGAILLIVVLFVLGRNLIKLYLDRTRGVPGSHYKTKVIALVGGLTLLPSLLLFFLASGLLQSALDQWFQPEVENVLNDGKDLLDRYEAEHTERFNHVAHYLADDLSERRLLRRAVRKNLAAYLEEKRLEHRLAAIRVYDPEGEVIGEAFESGREEQLRRIEVPRRALRDLLAGQSSSLRHVPEKTGDLLVYVGVPLMEADRRAGALVVTGSLGLTASTALASITRQWEVYQQAKANREGVRQGYVLVLALFTAVLVFAAIWVASALAKNMTVPIQRLAEATRAVSEGQFHVRVAEAAPDELGVLVRSFNQMLDELQQGRLKVETSTMDLRRTNRELESRRRYIETILDNSPTGVMSIDETGRITSLNRAGARMLGIDEREAVEGQFREVLARKEFLELRILIEKMMGIRDISLVREIHLRFARRTVDLAVSFTSLRDTEERYMGLVLVLEDISNLIRAQKVAAWREVARRIAHEIKNPLTPIQLSAQRILKKWRASDPDVGKVIEECTETITQYVDGLKTLVNEFSRFARMPPVAPVPTRLDKVIHSALVLYEGLRPGLRIEEQLAADIPTLNLDPEQMKRVLINLVDNAIDCQNGKGRVTVSALYDPRRQSARIEVADEGPGIPAEDREKLFVPYFSTKRGGTGLGLAIVHRIVSDHNGTIWVDANQPVGTRFVIELPA